jgi:hypothetical protein
MADLPENDLQVVPKNRIGTGPLFLQLESRLKSPFLENTRFSPEFSPALTLRTPLLIRPSSD